MPTKMKNYLKRAMDNPLKKSINEKKLSKHDMDTLQDKVDEIKAIVHFGESPFRELSYLITHIKKYLM